jgi:hypothetical protein
MLRVSTLVVVLLLLDNHGDAPHPHLRRKSELSITLIWIGPSTFHNFGLSVVCESITLACGSTDRVRASEPKNDTTTCAAPTLPGSFLSHTLILKRIYPEALPVCLSVDHVIFFILFTNI